MSNDKCKILVTGATGFIGRRLVESLVEKGHEPVCLVRKTSDVGSLKEKGLALSVADITDAGQVEKVFLEAGPEVVYHCAARVKGNREELSQANVRGTSNICQACYDHGVKRFIYLSSIAVISGNEEIPLNDRLPYKANNEYGRSKAMAEQIVVDFRRKGLPAAILRPCMVYGEDEPHALDWILKAVMRRRVPVLDFPGMDARLQLVHIDNVVRMMELALEKQEALEGTYIVADREILTIRKFFELLYDELDAGDPPVVPGWAVKIGMSVPFVKGKINRYFKDRVYDISRGRDLLGYTPAISTEEGLRKTVRYWKNKCQK
ncbi:MAG: NAD-dependent epimerase/dehydratase family protein [Candidatus Omnitrophota bacterium]